MGYGLTCNKLLASALLATILSGCGSMPKVDLWPFGADKAPDRSGRPSNATQYACSDGKGFYLRMLDNGNAAWVILPDREIRLDKTDAEAGTRYSNGIAVLEINGGQIALRDAPAISFTDCKIASAK